ncbi:MAG: VWA domain-containing protein [Bacteroidia bacterium]
MHKLFFFFLTLYLWLQCAAHAQNAGIQVPDKIHDYGALENIYTLESEFIIKNTNPKKLYFLRADVSRSMKVHITKKGVESGDTALLTVIYQPASTGRFSEDIKLVTSADAEPLILTLKGVIRSIKTDDKTACYYFGKPHKNTGEPVAIVFPSNPVTVKPAKPADSSLVKPVLPAIGTEPKDTVKTELPATTALDKKEYKPNNVIFLVDVSGSMRDSLKLPLMKEALYVMMKAMRDIDKITFITYSDSIKLLCEGVPGTEKKQLEHIVRGLKTSGYTKGAKAILYSLDVALQNYIPEGNNQIFLATDGKFTFYEGHYRQWTEKLGEKQVILSTICFGNDKDAVANLKGISEKGKGSFIRIKNRNHTDAVLEEVKLRSKR